MALKLILDTLDGLDDGQKALYVEKDGKFHLDVDGLEDTSGLKSALQKERERARDFEKKLSGLKDLDPDEYARLKKEADERADADAEKKGQWDQLKGQLLDKHQKELEASTGKVSAMQKALEQHLVDAEATRALAEAKGIPALLLPHVKAAVKVVEENGGYAVKVVDAQGNPRIVDGKGTAMTIPDLVAEMKKSDIFGRAFEGTGATGGGSQQNNVNRQGTPGTIAKGDPMAFGQNLEAIAKGEMDVV